MLWPAAKPAVLMLACGLMLTACGASRPVSPEEMKAYEVSVATAGETSAIAWHGYVEGTDAVHFEWLDARGRGRGAPVQVTAATTRALEPDLQLTGKTPFLAWYEKAPATGALTAWLGRLDAKGGLVWRRQMDGHGGMARNPVVRLNEGALDVAWIEAPTEAPKAAAVWTAKFGADGGVLGAPHEVGVAGPTTWNLNAAVDRSGVFHVVYDAPLGGRANELQLIAIKDGAVTRRQLSPEDGRASLYPDIGISDDGQAAVTWFDERDGNTEIYLTVGPLADLVAGPLPPVRRVSSTPADSIGAYLAWNGERLALAWCDADPGQQELYLQLFNRRGEPSAPIKRLTRTKAQTSIPSIRPQGRGFLIGWNDYVAEAGGEHGPDPESTAFTVQVP